MPLPFRLLFLACCAWGIATIWLAPQLPQIDLPQHAGQVALLRDMLQGDSAWSNELRINLLTPYLVGYLSLLLLSFAMPIESAIALVYSLAFAGFIAACVGLRRQLRADPRLDWLFLPAFFGVAWQWGFLTFLVASAFGVLFLIATYRHVEQPSPSRALAVLALGVVLLFSHGLVFLYAVPIGLTVAALAAAREGRRWTVALPYLALLAGFVIYKVAVLDAEMSNAAGSNDFQWGTIQHRLWSLMSSSLRRPELSFAVAAVCYAAPWVLGLRPTPSLTARVPFFWTLAMIVFYPAILWGATNFYDRFAFLLLPMYAVMFARPDPVPGAIAAASDRAWRSVGVSLLLFLAAALVLIRETRVNLAFARETRDIDRLFARMEPRKRVLYVPVGIGADLPLHYLHYPLWYQARHAGFVEFNFASLLPQIVRFRDFKKHITPDFSWSSAAADWKRFEGGAYDYVIFSGQVQIEPSLLTGRACTLVPVDSVRDWKLMRTHCAGR